MLLAGIQFYSWDKIYYFEPGEISLKEDDLVLAEHEFGLDVGRVIHFKEKQEVELEEPIKQVIKKLALDDLKKLQGLQLQKPEIMKKANDLINKHKLKIKLIDTQLSFDEKRLMFIFAAEGRVDFRDLLKDLTKTFKKVIRLQQIGPRDETREVGGVGPCGRPLCCSCFYNNLGNITMELAKMQQVAHRGSDRLSGVCGRLKCCLAYELKTYEEYSQGFPEIGDVVETNLGKGEVVEWGPLKRIIRVKITEGEDKDTIIEVPVNNLK